MGSVRKDSAGLSYYGEMLDLEGLDPELAGIEEAWLHPSVQRSLLSYLFKGRHMDLVRSMISEGVVAQDLGEKVTIALRAMMDIYHGFKVDGGALDLNTLTPRALAEIELCAWRPSLSNGEALRSALSVEVPVREDWIKREVDPGSEEAILKFYRESESYIFELMAANNLLETLCNYDILLDKLSRLGVGEFLDYGAGIGSLVILGKARGLSVCHMDLAGKTLDFARWRFKMRNLGIPVVCARGDHSDIPNSYAIVCTEVIEHVFEPHVLLDRFRRVVPRGGYVVISESCGYVEKFISHLTKNQWLAGKAFDIEMRARGFVEVLPEPRIHPRIFQRLE